MLTIELIIFHIIQYTKQKGEHRILGIKPGSWNLFHNVLSSVSRAKFSKVQNNRKYFQEQTTFTMPTKWLHQACGNAILTKIVYATIVV